MVLLAILLLFIIVPVVEIWLILEVAELLGGGTRGMVLTLLVLIIDSLIGAVLVRYQGRAALGRVSRHDERRQGARARGGQRGLRVWADRSFCCCRDSFRTWSACCSWSLPLVDFFVESHDRIPQTQDHGLSRRCR